MEYIPLYTHLTFQIICRLVENMNLQFYLYRKCDLYEKKFGILNCFIIISFLYHKICLNSIYITVSY